MRTRLGPTPTADEAPLVTELRAVLFEADAILAHDTETIATAVGLRATAGVDPATAAAALDVAAVNGDAARYDEYVVAMREAGSPQEAERYRFALGRFPGEAEIRRTIDSSLDGTVRAQDAPFLLRAALRNRDQGPTAWGLLSQRWADVLRVVPSNLVARMLEGISALAEPDLATDVDEFLAAHPLPQGHLMIAQHRERLRVHVAFRRRERTRLR